jgi:transglutaminase-like putative cysteine protease
MWVPVPPSNAEQDVTVEQQGPGPGQVKSEPKYGNKMFYQAARAGADGTVHVRLTYRVTRREVRAPRPADRSEKLEEFLRPEALVPVGGKPLELLRDRTLPEDPLALARTLYDTVNRHMRNSKEGTGWGRGDAVWACSSGYGNCSDFHSLFISLARAHKVPARFEVGFPLPEKRGSGEVAGYHCWAWFNAAGKGWVPVDISEANKHPERRDYYFGNLTEDRVAFSTGRDLVLEPAQDGRRVNFFVYPYVEVAGKPYPDDKVRKRFTYEDLPAGKGG